MIAAYSNAQPITLSCFSIGYDEGQSEQKRYFYIDVEKKEMLISEDRETWKSATDFNANKVSISGNVWKNKKEDVYTKYTIDRVNLKLTTDTYSTREGFLYLIFLGNCEILKFDIDTKF